jgi:hypothetical protein
VAQVAGLRSGPVVLGLELRETVAPELEPRALGLDVVELGVVAAEDRGLDRTVGRTERREAVLLLHRLGDFETAQPLDLPLRRTGPERIGAPADVVGANTLYEGPHEGCANIGLRHKRGREQLTHVAIDVADAVLRRDIGKVAGPGDSSGALELGKRLFRITADVAVGGVINDEVELRPILRIF